jgi:hypothetical protein
MTSSVMIYIPVFIMIGSGIRKLVEGDTRSHRYTDTQTTW